MLDKHQDRPLVDTALRTYRRDREIAGTVVGSALAFRLFLFFVPLLVFVVGLAGFLASWVDSEDVADSVGLSGGLAVVTLGWFFIARRVMVVSMCLGAVFHERFGTISRLVFSLSILRLLPRRSARMRRLFGLERTTLARHVNPKQRRSLSAPVRLPGVTGWASAARRRTGPMGGWIPRVSRYT